MSKTAFNRESYAKRTGRVIGYLMGKHVQDMDAAMGAFEMLGRGEINQFLKAAPEAVRVKVQTLLTPNGKPYALDARELQEMKVSATEKFSAAASAKTKPKAAAPKVAVRPKAPTLSM